MQTINSTYGLWMVVAPAVSDEEVYEFKCSRDLLFDVDRQICDFKAKVDNCGVNVRK